MLYCSTFFRVYVDPRVLSDHDSYWCALLAVTNSLRLMATTSCKKCQKDGGARNNILYMSCKAVTLLEDTLGSELQDDPPAASCSAISTRGSNGNRIGKLALSMVTESVR